MKRGTPGLLALALLAAACQAPAPPGGAHAATGAIVSNDSSGQKITTFSERFLLARTSDASGAHPFVIRERSRSTCCFAEEHDTHSTFIVERIIAGTDSVLWRGEAPFDAGGVEGDFYRGVEQGCCDAPDRYTYIALATGLPAFTLTPQLDHDWAAPVELDIPNTRVRRFLGFDVRTDLALPNDHDPHPAFGVLHYGDGAKPAARFIVRAAKTGGPELHYSSLRLRADTASGPGEFRMDLWAADGKTDPASITGATILLTFTDDASGRAIPFALPIVHDSLDLRHARLPAGWTVVPLR